jgi:ankyrin repeat protein
MGITNTITSEEKEEYIRKAKEFAELTAKFAQTEDFSELSSKVMEVAAERNNPQFKKITDKIFASNGIKTNHTKRPLPQRASLKNSGFLSNSGRILKISKSFETTSYVTKNDTELHIAAKDGYLQKVEEILKTNAILVIAKNELGFTALHYAAMNGHLKIVKQLIKRSPDVNAQTYTERQTALHFAASNNDIKMVNYLLESEDLEVDMRLTDKNNQTPLDIALRKKYYNVALSLKKHGMMMSEALSYHLISQEKQQLISAKNPQLYEIIDDVSLEKAVIEGNAASIHQSMKENKITDPESLLPIANKKLIESEQIIKLLEAWHQKTRYDRDYSINNNEYKIIIDRLNSLSKHLTDTIQTKPSELYKNVLIGFASALERQNPNLKKLSKEISEDFSTNNDWIQIGKTSLEKFKKWIEEANLDKHDVKRLPNRIQRFIDLLKESSLDKAETFFDKQAKVSTKLLQDWITEAQEIKEAKNIDSSKDKFVKLPILLKGIVDILCTEKKENITNAVNQLLNFAIDKELPRSDERKRFNESEERITKTTEYYLKHNKVPPSSFKKLSSNNAAKENRKLSKNDTNEFTLTNIEEGDALHKQIEKFRTNDHTEIKFNETDAAAFHAAVISGNIDKVKQLLTKGTFDINITNEYGETALHLAVEGDVKMVKLLIDNKANINASVNGKTPLHRAIICSNKNVVELLLNEGAEANMHPRLDRKLAWDKYFQCKEIVDCLEIVNNELSQNWESFVGGRRSEENTDSKLEKYASAQR